MMTFSLTGNCLYVEKLSCLMMIGAFAQEHQQQQAVEVSIAVKLPLLTHINSDNIEETFDYSIVVNMVHELSQEPYILVEFFAQKICERVLTDHRIEAVEVIVYKQGAFVDAINVGCRLLRSK